MKMPRGNKSFEKFFNGIEKGGGGETNLYFPQLQILL